MTGDNHIIREAAPSTSREMQEWYPFPFPTIAHNPSLLPILEKAFRWKSHTITTDELSIQVIDTGRSLVSLPHLSYGNIRCRPGLDPAKIPMLLDSLVKESAKPLEIRYPLSPTAGSPNPLLNYPKTTSILQLQLQPPLKSHESLVTRHESCVTNHSSRVTRHESCVTNPASRVTRHASRLTRHASPLTPHPSSSLLRKIRKSTSNGFTVTMGGTEMLDICYDLYARNIRRLGSASLPKNWFRFLLEEYRDGFCGLFLLEYQGKAVGSALCAEYMGFYENLYFAVLKPWHHLYGSYALYNAMIQHATEIPATLFSFGRSTTGSGVHRFKQQWGTEELPLCWLSSGHPSIDLRHHRWLHQLWRHIPWPLGTTVDHFISRRTY